MRSALGLRRIGGIDVTQVLRASEADVLELRACARAWGVPRFASWALLLRALTHPSISNWAERTLELPPRSLGPNALELLGDRVVGLCVAAAVRGWVEDAAGHTGGVLQSWRVRDGCTPVVDALVGNRGMAIVAERICIDRVMRWERPRPPASQRARLTRGGVDITTGLVSTTEINALSGAYEAVAAAVYLDGGFQAAQQFVDTTLLSDPDLVQRANYRLRDYERMLGQELSLLLGRPVECGRNMSKRGKKRAGNVDSGSVRCALVDLRLCGSDNSDVNDARSVFYAAVVLQRLDADGGASLELEEADFLSAACHFSIQSARMAAVTQAREALQGRRKSMSDTERHGTDIQARSLYRARAKGKSKTCAAVVHFECSSDRWAHDGDYRHILGALRRSDAGLIGAALAPDCTDNDARVALTHCRAGLNVTDPDLFDPHPNEPKMQWALPRGSGDCGGFSSSLGECLKIGENVHQATALFHIHPALSGDVADGEEVRDWLNNTLGELPRGARLQGYHQLGHHAFKLWSVQRSMVDSSMDRAQIIAGAEQRTGRRAGIARAMGACALIGESRGRARLFVGLGATASQFGVATTLAWLTGAEQRLIEGVHCKVGIP